MWAYLGIMTVGVVYALWKGASFFPALRQAQFQFASVRDRGDVSAYAPFVSGVIDTWPERMAQFPPGLPTLCIIVGGFLLGTLAFWLVRSRPRGRVIDRQTDGSLIAE